MAKLIDSVAILDSSLPRAFPTAVLMVALVSVPVMILQPQGLRRMQALKGELAKVHEENEKLEREIALLRSEIKSLRENPVEVERIARDQLGMVRKSEVVFQFRRAR